MTSTTTASSHRSLSIAAIIMMGSVLLSRVIGVFREMVLAGHGGTTFEMDAYVTAFIIPDLLNHFLASGFLSITFIPIFQQYYARNDPDNAWRSFSNLLTIGSIGFIILIPVAMFFTPQAMLLMGPHINDPSIAPLTIKLTHIILPAQLFFYWGAFFNAVQMAKERFFLPALTPLLYNAGIIAGGVLLAPFIGIEGFAWGVLAGSFLGNVAIPLFGALAVGMRFSPSCNIYHPDVKTYVVKTLPLILGVGMSFSTEFFFRFFGSFLSEGGTSSVNYALRTMMIVVAVFGQASGVAFFPFLSKLAAQKKFDEMTRMLNSLLRTIARYLIPISTILYICARPLVAILYERGKFDAASTIDTAAVFCAYLPGAFAFSAAIIIARSFYAMQRMVLPMVVSTAVALGTIPLYMLFSRLFGARGIAYAASAAMTLQYLILYGLWTRQYGSLASVLSEGVYLLKVCAVSFAAGVAGYFSLTRLVPLLPTFHLTTVTHVSTMLAIALPMFIVVLVLYEVTGIEKLRTFLRGLLRRK